MPRILVTTELSQLPDDAQVLLDEHVHSVHLSTGHASAQLVQRLAWAIGDAESLEGARLGQRTSPGRQSLRRSLSTRSGVRLPVDTEMLNAARKTSPGATSFRSA